MTVQLSFSPAYARAENVCRIPAYLPHLLPMGEHREPARRATLPVDDLAITATRDSLDLVTLSDRRIVEPQVSHALALDKRPPPLAAGHGPPRQRSPAACATTSARGATPAAPGPTSPSTPELPCPESPDGLVIDKQHTRLVLAI